MFSKTNKILLFSIVLIGVIFIALVGLLRSKQLNQNTGSSVNQPLIRVQDNQNFPTSTPAPVPVSGNTSDPKLTPLVTVIISPTPKLEPTRPEKEIPLTSTGNFPSKSVQSGEIATWNNLSGEKITLEIRVASTDPITVPLNAGEKYSLPLYGQMQVTYKASFASGTSKSATIQVL